MPPCTLCLPPIPSAPVKSPTWAQDMEVLGDLRGFTACLWRTASFSHGQLDEARAHFAQHPPSTIRIESCQRLEAYSSSPCQCEAQVRLTGVDALLHLASVAAGLHAAVLGEDQIMGQVRSAIAAASPELRSIGDIAVAAARELRRGQQFNTHSGHLLDRGLRLLGVPTEGSLLVVGTGHMARLIARRAAEHGFDDIIIAGRARPDAPWFTESSLRFVALHEVPLLDPVDIAVGCLGAGAPVLDPEAQLPRVRRLILDLGTPRNFAGHRSVPLVDIAALLEAGQAHTNERRHALSAELRRIIQHRFEMARTTGRSPVGAMRAAVEQVRAREASRIRSLHPEIPAETVDAITRSLVNQIFHLPTERLRELDDADLGHRFVALFAEKPLAPASPRCS